MHENNVVPPGVMSLFEASLKGQLRNATIRLLTMAVIQIEPGWSVPWAKGNTGDFWRIYWNDRPMSLQVGAADIRLPKHRIGLIPPLADFKPAITSTTRHAYLHFVPTALPVGLLAALFPRPLVLERDPVTEQLMRTLCEFSEHATAPPPVSFLAQAVAHMVFAMALCNLSVSATEKVQRALRGENPVSPALARIQGALHEPPHLDELARLCGMSRRAFSDIFRHWTGRSPLQYQLHERLLQAEELLVSSDASIEFIAVRCGFSDRYHFSKAFRRFQGQGPATYRRRMQRRRTATGSG